MKKLLKISLSLSLVLVFLCVSLVKNASADELYVDARCAIALDCDSKLILYEKNAYTSIPIASTTKIITSLVALKYGDLDKRIIISDKAASIHGSEVGYKKGEEVSLRELLYGLMLRSGNDAAIAIAEGIGGSVEEFVKLMNEYALEIGLLNSHFESPHGLDSNYHYSTAYDLAMATSKAKEIKLFNDIVNSKDIDAVEYKFSRSYHNINKILWLLPGANGVKTGYTGKAGKCLVTSVKIKDRDVIIVTLNCTPRWKETAKISSYIEKHYEYKKLVSKDQVLAEFSIKNGKSNAEIISKRDIILPVKQNEELQVKIVKPIDEVYAPLKKHQNLGRVDIYAKDKLVFTEALILKNSVEKKNNFKNTLEKIKNFIIPSNN